MPGAAVVVVVCLVLGSTGARAQDAGVPETEAEAETETEVDPLDAFLDVEADPEDSYGATATVEAPPRETTRHTIESNELLNVAGTRGDALRAVELLPGVARPPFGSGFLIVRGAAPTDTETFFDTVPVPLLYHFGGLTSFVQSRLLERIDFYPGNFSARFGRKMGGILEVSARDPHRDRWHGMADLNLIDASLLIEGPVGQNASVAVAGRRSYIDFFFESLFSDDTFSVLAAPVYWDYQVLGTWRPSERDRLRLQIYGSSDELRLLFSDPLDDPTIRGNLGFRTAFHRVHASWHRQLPAGMTQQIDASSGVDTLFFRLGDTLGVDAAIYPVNVRAEWSAPLSRTVSIRGGIDFAFFAFTYDFGGPQPGQSEGSRDFAPLASRPLIERRATREVWRPAFYWETDLRPIDPLQLLLGLRLDYSSDIREWAFDPRLVARYSLDEDWTLKAGVGIYSQPPEPQESQRDFGNPELEMIHSLHTSAGVERRIDEAWSVSVEGFAKYLWDRVVGTPGGVPPIFVNDGIGRIFGLEVGVRAVPAEGNRYSGFLSYTLSRSERRDRISIGEEGWRLFDFDQTHILTASLSYRLGRGWELGGTFRLVSGNPYTPIVGSIYDANSDVYAPVLGETNARRSGLFHRLDLRIEKKWQWEHWSLALYLDVQNAYNAQPAEGEQWNYDYSESREVPGLPIIPSLGIRGEL